MFWLLSSWPFARSSPSWMWMRHVTQSLVLIAGLTSSGSTVHGSSWPATFAYRRFYLPSCICSSAPSSANLWWSASRRRTRSAASVILSYVLYSGGRRSLCSSVATPVFGNPTHAPTSATKSIWGPTGSLTSTWGMLVASSAITRPSWTLLSTQSNNYRASWRSMRRSKFSSLATLCGLHSAWYWIENRKKARNWFKTRLRSGSSKPRRQINLIQLSFSPRPAPPTESIFANSSAVHSSAYALWCQRLPSKRAGSKAPALASWRACHTTWFAHASYSAGLRSPLCQFSSPMTTFSSITSKRAKKSIKLIWELSASWWLRSATSN